MESDDVEHDELELEELADSYRRRFSTATSYPADSCH
jgi:hypothetical protein